MRTAWLLGLLIIVLPAAAWVAADRLGWAPGWLYEAQWMAVMAGAATTSRLAPFRKVALAVTLALPAALLPVAIGAGYQVMGVPVDFAGWRGAMILVGTGLASNIVVCVVGGLLGVVIARWRSRPARQSGARAG